MDLLILVPWILIVWRSVDTWPMRIALSVAIWLALLHMGPAWVVVPVAIIIVLMIKDSLPPPSLK